MSKLSNLLAIKTVPELNKMLKLKLLSNQLNLFNLHPNFSLRIMNLFPSFLLCFSSNFSNFHLQKDTIYIYIYIPLPQQIKT